MPMDKKRYPADWDAISQRIRFERAGGKCEQCGLAHGAYIVRSSKNPARYIVYDPKLAEYTYSNGERIHASEFPVEFDGKESKVTLTTHHIGVDKPDGTKGDPHDKMDVRDENLIALCNRCHFIADLPIHIINARITRDANRAKRAEAERQLKHKIQPPLFGE